MVNRSTIRRLHMKLLILAALLLTSCNTEPYDYEASGMVEVIEIDSCEYVRIHTPTGDGLAHKGNCKYCVERDNKDLQLTN